METTVNFSIDVPDLDAGLRFYRRVFGFREVARPFPTMAVLDTGNVTLCMHQKVAGTPWKSCHSMLSLAKESPCGNCQHATFGRKCPRADQDLSPAALEVTIGS